MEIGTNLSSHTIRCHSITCFLASYYTQQLIELRLRACDIMIKCNNCRPLKWYDHSLLSRGAIENSLHLLLRRHRHPPPSIAIKPYYQQQQQQRRHHFHYRCRNISHSIIYFREFASKSSSLSSSASSPQGTRRQRKLYGYLVAVTLSFLSLNSFAIYTHYHDDIFHSYYPFPIAFDVGHGPSMLPTIGGGDEDNDNNLYLRDCWSHRFVWFDYEHCKTCLIYCLRPILLLFSRVESDKCGDADRGEETGQGESDNNYCSVSSSSSFSRPWQKGDIVTLYNPYTKSLVTKRIIGVGGDYVSALGQYARELYCQRQLQQQHRINDKDDRARKDDDSVGAVVVPHDARFPAPFYRMILSSQSSPYQSRQLGKEYDKEPQQQQGDEPNWYKSTIFQVPPNHVWLEGDNPMHSTDSRHYGPIAESALRGRIIRRIWPLGEEYAVLDTKRPPLPTRSPPT